MIKKIPPHDFSMHPDLNLDEVAMIIHTFLKRLDRVLQTMVMTIEKCSYDITDENNIEKQMSTEKYTLTIITSYNTLSNEQIKEIIEQKQTKSIKRRGEQ